MSRRRYEPYQTFREAKELEKQGQPNQHPYPASSIYAQSIADMLKVSRSEGFEILYSDVPYEDFCGYVGSARYGYDPESLEAWVDWNLPWPEYRWYSAVVLGHHFTRHYYFEGESREEWRKAAQAWAATYLATHTAKLTQTSWSVLPRHAEKERTVPNPAATAQLERNPIKCHGITTHGYRCHSSRLSGSAFCRHHQGQAGTAQEMAQLVASLAQTLEVRPET